MELATEESHKNNMQAEYDVQIQVYKLFAGKRISSSIEQQFEAIKQRQVSSR
jgi:hypothetical protein